MIITIFVSSHEIVRDEIFGPNITIKFLFAQQVQSTGLPVVF